MTAPVPPPEQAPGDGLREASEKCSKPGCGALRLLGRPCTDWDCPQQWISAAEHRQALARMTAERDEARDLAEQWEATAAAEAEIGNERGKERDEAQTRAVDLVAENARLNAALLTATANLCGAASAYRKYASRHRSVGRSEVDPFFTTRAGDFDKAVVEARSALANPPST